MPIEFQQGDAPATCVAAAGCTGASLTAGTPRSFPAVPSGATGITPLSVSIPASETGRVVLAFDLTNGAFTVGSGDASVKINQTAAGANSPRIDDIYICRYNNACASQETIGSLTGIAGSWASPSIKTYLVPCSQVAIGATDRIAVLFILSNTSSMSAATAEITPDQIITFQDATTARTCFLPLLGVG